MSILTETESRGANFQWIDKMLMFVDINNPRDFQIQALGRARKFMNALKNDVMGGKKSVAEIERLFPVIIKVPESQLNYVRHYLGKTPEETISRKELFQTIEHKSIPILATSLAKQLHRFITEIIRSAALHVLMSPQSSESDQNLAVSAYVSKRSIHPSETEIELPLSAQIITSYEEKYSPLIEKFRAILSPQQLKEIHSRCVKADTYLDFLSQAEIQLDKEDGIEEIEQSLTLEDNVYRENTEAILPHLPRPEQSLSCLGSGYTRCLHNIFDDINDLNSTFPILVSQDFKTIAEKSLEYNNRYFRPLEYMAYVEYPSPNNPLQINRHWLGLDYSGLDYLLGDRSTRLPKHTALTLVDNQAHIYIDETNVGPNLIKDVVSLCNAYNSNYVGS